MSQVVTLETFSCLAFQNVGPMSFPSPRASALPGQPASSRTYRHILP